MSAKSQSVAANKLIQSGIRMYVWGGWRLFGALMNRKKKINQTLKSKAKKANAKLRTNNKPKYIAKADREALAAQTEIVPLETAPPAWGIRINSLIRSVGDAN